MKNFVDGPHSPEEVNNFRKKRNRNQILGSVGCLVMAIAGFIVAIIIVIAAFKFVDYLVENIF